MPIQTITLNPVRDVISKAFSKIPIQLTRLPNKTNHCPILLFRIILSSISPANSCLSLNFNYFIIAAKLFQDMANKRAVHS